MLRMLEISALLSPFPSFIQRLVIHLTFKGERGSDLVASLVEGLGVERKTEAESGTSVELGAVGKSGDTTVVDLGLLMD